MSERLSPIPTPPSQLWRQVRLQYVPVVVFVAGLVAAIAIWTRWVAPPTLVGEAEAVRTEVRSAQSGTLAELNCELLQTVTAGQLLGRVFVNDPKVLEASLEVIRAEIEVLRTSTDMNFERLRLDWMSKRVELVSLRTQLQQAESTLSRVTSLHRINLATDEELEIAKNNRNGLQARVKAQEELINRLEPELRDSDVAGARTIPTAAAEGLRAAVRQKEAQLRLVEAQLSPVSLHAPISGIVTQVYRRTGEAISGAEPIVQISATRSERIIGFLRQPLPFEPKPGMEVEVRTRTFQRQIATSQITQVGVGLEPVSPSLLAAMRLPVTTLPTDFGVRVLIAPPQGLTLRPGEHVDLIIRN